MPDLSPPIHQCSETGKTLEGGEYSRAEYSPAYAPSALITKALILK